MIIDKVHITKFRAIWPVNTPYFARQSPCACAGGLPGNAWRHAGNKSRRKGRQSVYQAVFAGWQDIPAQLRPGQVFPPIM